MKRATLLLLLVAFHLTAFEALTEAKVAYFLPTDAQFRNHYGQDGLLSTLEASFSAGDNFYPWASVSYFGNTGHTNVGGKRKSHISFIPIGAGMKYLYFFEHLGVYGGLGALPIYLHIENHSPLLARREKKWGCGGVAKVGLIADRLWNFFLDLFAEYSYIKIPFHKTPATALHPANLSHFSIGGGIGYHFGIHRDESDED